MLLALPLLPSGGGPDLRTIEARQLAMARVEAVILQQLQGAWVVDVQETRRQDADNRGDEIAALRYQILGAIWGLQISGGRACPASNMTPSRDTEQPGCTNVVVRYDSPGRFLVTWLPEGGEDAARASATEEEAYFAAGDRFCREIDGLRTCYRRATSEEAQWLVPFDEAEALAGCVPSLTTQEYAARRDAEEAAARAEAEANGSPPPAERTEVVVGRAHPAPLPTTTPLSFHVPRVPGGFSAVEAHLNGDETPRADAMRTRMRGEWREEDALQSRVRISDDEFCWIDGLDEQAAWRCQGWSMQASHGTWFSVLLEREFSRSRYVRFHPNRLCVAHLGMMCLVPANTLARAEEWPTGSGERHPTPRTRSPRPSS